MAPPLAKPHASNIRDILNGPREPPAKEHPPLIKDSVRAQRLIEQIIGSTADRSVEQLEQIYSVLMNEIWRTRGEWDRTKVIAGCKDVFLDTMEDIREYQDVE
jgi:hypothetical protein